MQIHRIGTFLTLTALALAGCTPHVRMSGDWADGAARGQSFSRVLVVGVSPNASVRCDFESFMRTQLRYVGAEAQESCNLMRTTDPLTVDGIEAAVREFGADAVLATVLVAGEAGATEGGSRDTRGDAYYKATGSGYEDYYYPGYRGYYGGYGVYGVPVTYVEFQTAETVTSVEGKVTIRSMLFATRDRSLVYEVRTTATDLSSRDNALATITEPLAEKLARAGIVAAVAD